MNKKITKKYVLKKNIFKDKCRLKGCSKTPHCRGLCNYHVQCVIEQGTLEKFGAPHRMKRVYKRKKKPDGKTCLIEGCSDEIKCRGICSKHYGQLKRRGLYEKFAFSYEG